MKRQQEKERKKAAMKIPASQLRRSSTVFEKQAADRKVVLMKKYDEKIGPLERDLVRAKNNFDADGVQLLETQINELKSDKSESLSEVDTWLEDVLERKKEYLKKRNEKLKAKTRASESEE